MQLLLMETDGFLYAHSVFLRAAIEIISHIHSKIIFSFTLVFLRSRNLLEKMYLVMH